MNDLAVSIRIAQAYRLTLADIQKPGPDRHLVLLPGDKVEISLHTGRPGAGLQLPTAPSAGRFVPLNANFQPCDPGGHAYVHDCSTGLIWTAGNVSSDRLNWEAADKACKALGEGWRLPTRAELLSLVDDTRHGPCIDTTLFPGTESNWYWTATPAAWSAECAWFVSFDYGSAGNGHRDDDAFVRAVRSAAPAASSNCSPKVQWTAGSHANP